MNDDELVAGIRAGDATAFRGLYADHKATVERSCAFFLGDDPGMKEAVAGTFKGAYAEIAVKGKPDLPLKPWLSILAVRYCMPVMERRRLEYLAQARELEELSRRVPVLQEITRDDRERVNFMVRGEIDDIPEPHKQILAMHEMDGLSILEMAKRLNAAWVTVLSRLYNARLALRDRVKAQFKA